MAPLIYPGFRSEDGNAIDIPMAYQPGTGGKKNITYTKDGRVMIDGVECVSCSEKRRLRKEKLESDRLNRSIQ